jgi:hypothetical protein
MRREGCKAACRHQVRPQHAAISHHAVNPRALNLAHNLINEAQGKSVTTVRRGGNMRAGARAACHLAVRVGYIGIKEVRGFNHVAAAAPKAQHFAHATHGSLDVAFTRMKLNVACHAKAAGKADVALPARASLPGQNASKTSAEGEGKVCEAAIKFVRLPS